MIFIPSFAGWRGREKQRGGVPAEMNRAIVDLFGFPVTTPLRRNQKAEPRFRREKKSLSLKQTQMSFPRGNKSAGNPLENDCTTEGTEELGFSIVVSRLYRGAELTQDIPTHWSRSSRPLAPRKPTHRSHGAFSKMLSISWCLLPLSWVSKLTYRAGQGSFQRQTRPS